MFQYEQMVELLNFRKAQNASLQRRLNGLDIDEEIRESQWKIPSTFDNMSQN